MAPAHPHPREAHRTMHQPHGTAGPRGPPPAVQDPRCVVLGRFSSALRVAHACGVKYPTSHVLSCECWPLLHLQRRTRSTFIPLPARQHRAGMRYRTPKRTPHRPDWSGILGMLVIHDCTQLTPGTISYQDLWYPCNLCSTCRFIVLLVKVFVFPRYNFIHNHVKSKIVI